MKLTVIFITKNSEEKLEDAIVSVSDIADEILVIDGNSTDRTSEITERHKARVVAQVGKGYSDWRNQGRELAKSEWILYLDYDERLTPNLAKEIRQAIKEPAHYAYAIPRRNVILGREMRHGGWWPDYVKRLFKKDKLEKWVGDLHEEPIFEGELGHLKNPMVHIKHDNLSEMVEKTNTWSEIEAKLLLEANHPPMAPWRFVRIMLTELFYRLFVKLGILDGPEGIIYSFYQMYSRFITYGKLWEMQQRK